MSGMRRLLAFFQAFIVGLGLLFLTPETAAAASKYGIHILHPGEVRSAAQLLKDLDGLGTNEWRYVTVPLALKDTQNPHEWEAFFHECAEYQLLPIVRLVTAFDGTNWTVPSRADTVTLLNFISQFDWPGSERYVILYNEVNHAAEWGGSIDPAGYAETLRFGSNWARTQDPPLFVLPAGLDLAAPTGTQTMDAFQYWAAAYAADPEIFTYADGWTAHAYPNPGFVSPPTYLGRDGLYGFEYEQEFLNKLTDGAFGERGLPIFITETGWRATFLTRRYLPSYYKYAVWHIWSDPQVRAVTPFLLQGDPGPFAEFGFIDAAGEPTVQFEAYQDAVRAFAL